MMSSLSHRLAEELQLKIVGPPLEITGITSPNHPEKNQLIPLLELKGKNREGIASALSVGNCFLTTEEIYHELHSELPNRHTWLLTSAAEIRTVFIALLIRFDTYHTPRPSLLLESVGGKVSENSQKALRELGTRIPEDAFIGPQTVIGERSEIGSGTVVLGQTYIGYDVKIGKNAFIHPQVTIHNGTQIGNNTIIHSGTVLGSDGFGYEPSPQGMRKIPQIGNVKIGDDVEIGSNCSVDRANLNSTQIGNRVKIDNLVQIGHNVSIGDDSVIVSQTGIAGSTVIGKQVVLGGQVGVADHVVIGDGVKVASKSGILPNKKIPPGTVLRGIPAIEHIQQTRIEIAMKNLIKKTSGSQDIDTKHLLPIHIPQYGIYDIYHNDNNELVVICFYVDRNPEKIQYEYNHRLLPFTVYPCANKISCVYKLGGVDYQERIRLIIDGNVVATSVNKYPVYRDEIIFSTLVKNEDNYIKQWIQFHLNIGIKRVIIYDNGEGDDKGYSHTSVERSSNLPVLLKEYIDSGTVLLIKWAYPKRMHGMINGQTTQQCHSIHAFQTSKYIGLFDIDEYVNIQRKTNIDTFFKDLIAERRIDVEKIGGFQIRNKFFFNPEHLPTAGLEFLKIFHCSAVTKKGCEKSFVIPKKVNTYNIHNVSNGTKLYRVDPRYVFFNHYYFLNKPIRGRNLTDLKDDSILIHLD